MERYKTDVLVIGGGGAGARAAIAAADSGADVLMIFKGGAGHTGATTYDACEIAGYNVPDGSKDPSDNPDVYEQDILDAGMGMADPALARILAQNAQNSMKDLEKWGLTFEKKDDQYLVMKGCFSSKYRGHIIKGHGRPVMQVLHRQIKSRSRIRIAENTTAISLLTHGGVCVGAVILDENGTLKIIEAGAVILATGGASQVFQRNLNPKDVTGDGYRLAHEAGAKLTNMEFMQAGIGFSHPIESLFNTYLWAGLPVIRNGRGEEFLSKNLPDALTGEKIMKAHRAHFPFSTRDNSKYVEIAIQREIAEMRGTARGGISVNFAHFTPEYVGSIRDESSLPEMFPMVLEHFRAQGVDLLRDEIEISCYAQAINGGVAIDGTGMSSLAGLFAAGEVAGGPHGADRLGGNMFVTCQVFGKIAGENAAAYAKQTARASLQDKDIFSQIEKVSTRAGKKLSAEELEAKLKLSAQEHLLICRTQQGLQCLSEDIDAIYNEIDSAPAGDTPLPDMLALMGKLAAAKLMCRFALLRKETRGSHYRADYPACSEDFNKRIIL